MSLTTGFSEINLLAVLVAGVAHMVTGLVWYTPKLFGNAWAELTGKDLKPARQWLAAGIIGHQVIALALAMTYVRWSTTRCASRLNRAARCASASAIPTALAKPWPSGPVVVSTPGVWPRSGWPGVRLPHCRKLRNSSRGRS